MSNNCRGGPPWPPARRKRTSLLIHAARQEAAVHRDDLAAHETRSVGCEEDRGTRELVDVSKPLHRCAHEKLAATFSLVQQLLIERGAKDARRNSVHTHATTRP